LQTIYLNPLNDIVDLAHHVALSENQEYEDLFLLYASDIKADFKIMNVTYIHRASEIYNCYSTIRLFIKLVGITNVDKQNRKNLAATFLSAEHGHVENLKCLLDSGANVDFEVHCNTSISCLNGTYIIKQFKEVCMCEYTLPDIAVQNEHYEVVKMLLMKNPLLLNHVNGIGLNLLHIAVEKGNILVMQEILKVNRSLADTHSLYIAASNGFVRAVEILLSIGVKDMCLKCNGTFYWKDNITENEIDETHTCDNLSGNKTNFKNMLVWPVDWRLVTCNTALHAAVQNGHVSIVHILLDHNINSCCRDNAGMTAIFLAIKNNQTDIFKILYERKANVSERCRVPPRLQRTNSRFFSSSMAEYDTHNCGENSSIVHLLAIHNNVEITTFLLSKGFNEWMTDDSIMASGIHYGFCHGSHKFVSLIERQVNFNTALLQKTIHGYTPYHVAVQCGNSLRRV
jgi:ankyrin repeat protein